MKLVQSSPPGREGRLCCDQSFSIENRCCNIKNTSALVLRNVTRKNEFHFKMRRGRDLAIRELNQGVCASVANLCHFIEYIFLANGKLFPQFSEGY